MSQEISNQEWNMAKKANLVRPRHKFAPFTRAERKERRDEVYKLHFEYGIPVLQNCFSQLESKVNLYIVYWSILHYEVYHMSDESKRPLKIMIVEDDEDILTLYSDYLSRKGYHVIARYTRGNNIKEDLERDPPDVFLINSLLPGKKNGADVATEILDIYPEAPILFITADFQQPEQIEKNPVFRDKKIDILIKPVKLREIEHSILNLVNK
jgi:CheY-like chemotaxis protein